MNESQQGTTIISKGGLKFMYDMDMEEIATLDDDNFSVRSKGFVSIALQ